MAIDFPNSPSLNDEFSAGTKTWKWDGSAWRLVGGGVSLTIDELTDVDTTGVTSGDFLKYDGTEWVPDAVPAINALDDIGDVTITSPSAGETISYNGTVWVNGPGLPSGSITQFAGISATAPTGWLFCEGQAVSRTTYASLFAAVGTAYGAGDGSTTFNLPNLKGRIPVGRDTSQTEFDALGETGGAKTHTLTTAELPSHSHTINHDHGAFNTTGGEGAHGHAIYGLNTGIPAGTNGFGIGMLRLNDGGYNYASTVAGAHNHSIDVPAFSGSSGNTGSGNAHNNLQPYIVLNYIIKV